MKIRYSKSHISRKCSVCTTQTYGNKIYEEGGISIRVPVCERDKNECHTKVFVKDMAKKMLRQLKGGISA